MYNTHVFCKNNPNNVWKDQYLNTNQMTTNSVNVTALLSVSFDLHERNMPAESSDTMCLW